MKERCGDISTSTSEKVFYFLYNLVRVCRDLFSLPPRHYSPYTITKGVSFGEACFFSFLLERLPKYLKKKNIRVLDIGSGPGRMREYLKKAGYTGEYTGIDVNYSDEFNKFNFGFKSIFIESKAEDYKYDREYDLVISKSSLEHIELDKIVIQRSKKIARFHLHLIPATWSLFLFIRHGWRQYTRRDIYRMFGRDFKVLGVGGLCSTLHHFFTITLPVVLLKNNKGRYTEKYSLLSYEQQNKFNRLVPITPLAYIIYFNKQ